MSDPRPTVDTSDPTTSRAGACARLGAFLAVPEILTILGLLSQHVYEVDWIEEIPGAVGRPTYFVITTVLGGLAALLAIVALARYPLLRTGGRVAAVLALVFGGGYFLVLMTLKLFTKELQPF